ncbi:hypothetical protein ACFQZJ_07045 [Maribacter chungangensis]|uniref:Uncharacterized protein n=1 Tax=Maribacter chungangensis TaxID=1069117 RepID=A0ABW3B3K4_9FLAO
MSKRGTLSAKFIGGKSWEVGHTRNDLPKRLKKMKEQSKTSYLLDQFDQVATSFGLSGRNSLLQACRKKFVNDLNDIKQRLFLENIDRFKSFAEANGLEFTLVNYFENKYYLKDYTGIVQELGFNFDGLKRKELIEEQVEIRKLPISEEQKQVIFSQLDFLINNSERKIVIKL